MLSPPSFSWLATEEPGYSFIGTRQQPLARDPAAGSLLGSAVMRGGTGADVLRSEARTSLVLIGGMGDDVLHGSATAQRLLIGGAGDDTYVLRSTGDILSDMAGNDTAILVTELAHALAAGANAVVALAGGMPPAEPWLAPITLELAPGIENLTAIVWERSWSMSFDLVGNEGANRLIGDSFANVLVGNGGDDTIFGHGGDDRLDGGTGDDALNGGDGRDHLTGGAGHDVLSGGAGDDLLEGGAGNDRLDGGPGDDQLLGGDGNDTLVARLGSDLLDGGAGDDLFFIGHRAGAVTLIGGPGADRFVVEARPGDLMLHFADFLAGEDELDLAAWLGTGRMQVTETAIDGAASAWLVTAPERSIALSFASDTLIAAEDNALAIA
ncbi:MAG: hypothetical protein H6852_10365 [Geminicoccaceae bacterium]|jgi:Ca2+-binding RTX toxin-like protein|nr:hypothetical protein [Geminicoccaceae bacterium]HRY23746.1 calcium-binding protein [Geminicoccaceae bacterium]